MQYIATFFSHYAAVLFVRRLSEEGITGTLMPVPRRVSSSCGTGVQFRTDMALQSLAQEGVDKIFLQEGDAYRLAYENTEEA